MDSAQYFAEPDTPFVKILIERGHTHKLDIGVQATPEGEVVGETGRPSGIVYTFGTALKDRLE